MVFIRLFTTVRLREPPCPVANTRTFQNLVWIRSLLFVFKSCIRSAVLHAIFSSSILLPLSLIHFSMSADTFDKPNGRPRSCTITKSGYPFIHLPSQKEDTAVDVRAPNIGNSSHLLPLCRTIPHNANEKFSVSLIACLLLPNGSSGVEQSQPSLLLFVFLFHGFGQMLGTTSWRMVETPVWRCASRGKGEKNEEDKSTGVRSTGRSFLFFQVLPFLVLHPLPLLVCFPGTSIPIPPLLTDLDCSGLQRGHLCWALIGSWNEEESCILVKGIACTTNYMYLVSARLKMLQTHWRLSGAGPPLPLIRKSLVGSCTHQRSTGLDILSRFIDATQNFLV